ncbi:MAG: PIN domain-containing protein [Bacteroidota bacterium]
MIFIDSDVLIDVALRRSPFWKDAARLLVLVDKGEVEAVTSTLVLSNTLYIVQKQSNKLTAHEFLAFTLQLLDESPLNFTHLTSSLDSTFTDKEDGFNFYSAKQLGVKIIISRNIRDYKKGDLPVLSPRAYLQEYFPNYY